VTFAPFSPRAKGVTFAVGFLLKAACGPFSPRAKGVTFARWEFARLARNSGGAMTHAIFWPMVAQVGLVALVWVRMYATRLAEMKARRIAPQAVATSTQAAAAFQNVAAADNLRNRFEVPVLFFAVSLAAAA
jgi:hypothetical protein